MLAGVTRPLIFVDIDGVLIPFRSRMTGTGRRSSGGAQDAPDGSGNPLLERLDPADGRRLLALPGELVWASTWMAEANDVVAPRLDLPALPFVNWPDADEEPQRGVHWKTMPPNAVGGRTPVCLARRRDHRRRPAMGRHAPPAAGVAPPRRPVPRDDQRRSCGSTPVAQTARRSRLTSYAHLTPLLAACSPITHP
jgi:hypothetical protein